MGLGWGLGVGFGVGLGLGWGFGWGWGWGWDWVGVGLGLGLGWGWDWVGVGVGVGVRERKTLGHQPGTCSKNPRYMPGVTCYCRFATIYSVRKTLGKPSKNPPAANLGGGQKIPGTKSAASPGGL